jgi:hemin uptake protein HemP
MCDVKNIEDHECRCKAAKLWRESGTIESAHLFGKRKEILIQHEGELYRLRITKNGKLILNK